MSEETIGRNPTRIELLASEYQSCIINIHNLIYQFGGDEDVIAVLMAMRDVMDATIDSLKRRYSMVYGHGYMDSIDIIVDTIQKISKPKEDG